MIKIALRDALLVRSGGSNATIKGYLTDIHGKRVPLADGTTFQLTLMITNTAKTMATLLGETVPAAAVFFDGVVATNSLIIGSKALSGSNPTPDSAFGDILLSAGASVKIGKLEASADGTYDADIYQALDGVETLLTTIEDDVDPGTMGADGSQAVSTTVLRVLGASSWTGATTNGAVSRTVLVANCSSSLHLYAKLVQVGASLTGAVTSSNFEVDLPPLQTYIAQVPAGYDLCVVRGSSSSDVAYAREVLD